MKRFALGTAVSFVLVVLSAGVALGAAQSMASGGGQSHRGASYGFNAKADLGGSFQYNGVTQYAVTVGGVAIPAGTRFSGHCFGYYRVSFGGNEASLFALCRGMFFPGGSGPPVRGQIYLQAHVFDNGEPGTNDVACIDWGLNPSPGMGDPGLISTDCGTVQTGNIQVH